jgi:hypothetical protein
MHASYHVVLVTGSEREAKACSTLHAPMLTLFRVCVSLALESIVKEASHKQHILKIAAAGSSVTAHCFETLTMERLFSPGTDIEI